MSSCSTNFFGLQAIVRTAKDSPPLQFDTSQVQFSKISNCIWYHHTRLEWPTSAIWWSFGQGIWLIYIIRSEKLKNLRKIGEISKSQKSRYFATKHVINVVPNDCLFKKKVVKVSTRVKGVMKLWKNAIFEPSLPNF